MIADLARALTSVERHALRRSAIVAGIGTAVGLAVPFLLMAFFGDPVNPLAVLGAALALGGVGGFGATFVPFLRLGADQNAPLRGLSSSERSALVRSITRRRPAGADTGASADERDRDLSVARGFVGWSSLALALYGFLYVGLIGSQLYTAGDEPGPEVVRLVLLAVFITALVLFVGFFTVRIVRAARFVAERVSTARE